MLRIDRVTRGFPGRISRQPRNAGERLRRLADAAQVRRAGPEGIPRIQPGHVRTGRRALHRQFRLGMDAADEGVFRQQHGHPEIGIGPRCDRRQHLRTLSGGLGAHDGRGRRDHRELQRPVLQFRTGRPLQRRGRHHDVLRGHLRPHAEVGSTPAGEPPWNARVPYGLRPFDETALGRAWLCGGSAACAERDPRHLRRFPETRYDVAEEFLHGAGHSQRLRDVPHRRNVPGGADVRDGDGRSRACGRVHDHRSRPGRAHRRAVPSRQRSCRFPADRLSEHDGP